jgi:hypothetical protein
MNAIDKLTKKHIERFGVEPNVIGLLWSDIDKQIDLLIEAIKTGEPYDEYQMLSKSEQQAFDNNDIVF